jgi:hypothetical protein
MNDLANTRVCYKCVEASTYDFTANISSVAGSPSVLVAGIRSPSGLVTAIIECDVLYYKYNELYSFCTLCCDWWRALLLYIIYAMMLLLLLLVIIIKRCYSNSKLIPIVFILLYSSYIIVHSILVREWDINITIILPTLFWYVDLTCVLSTLCVFYYYNNNYFCYYYFIY